MSEESTAGPARPSGADRALVVGGGTMGFGIGWVCAVAGFDVTLVEPDPVRRRALVDSVQERAAKQVARDPEGPSTHELTARLDVSDRIPVTVPDGGWRVAVEAVPERLDLKRTVLAALAEQRPRLLGTNTSSIAISDLAADLDDPAALVGLHFFNPVWAMPLLEIVRQPSTPDAVLAEAYDIAARLGKEVITVADQPGFATSRLGVAIGLEAMRMLQDGVASAADIDRAMELGYRHPMGPLRLSDLVGLDVRLDIARTLQRAHGDRFAPPQILIDLVAAGDLGRKTGRGFHDWSNS